MKGRRLIIVFLMAIMLLFSTEAQASSVSFTYDETTKTLTFSGNGMIESSNDYEVNEWYQYASVAEHLVIEEGITGIERYAFADFGVLKDIDFPERMTYLAEYIFWKCNSLTEVTLPDGISFFDTAFTDCDSLKKVVFGSSEGVDSISFVIANFFSGCTALEEIVVPENNSYFYTEDNVLFSRDGYLMCYPPALQHSSYKVPEGTNLLATKAFSYCKNLEEITFPDSLEMVCQTAFYVCDNITSLTFPESVKAFHTSEYHEPSIVLCDNLQVITNNSDAELLLNNGEAYTTDDGMGSRYWVNTETGKIVSSLTNGTVEIKKFGRALFLDEYIEVNGVTYQVSSVDDEYTIEEMNDGAYAGTLKTYAYTAGFELLEEVEINGWRYKVTEITIQEPGKCRSFTAELYDNKVKLSWLPASSTYAYKIYYKKSEDSEFTYFGETTKESMEIENLSGGEYTFKIVPYITLEGNTYENHSTETVSVYVEEKYEPQNLNVKVSFYGYNDVKVSWSAVKNAKRYVVNYKHYENDEVVKTGTSMNIENCINGRTYTFKVTPIDENGQVLETLDSSTASIYIPAADTSKLNATLYGHDDIKVTWNKVKGVSGYKVYYKKASSSSYTYKGKTTGTSAKFKDLSDGVKYRFKIVPYTSAGSADAKKTVSIYTLKKLAQPTVKKVSSTKVRVYWKNIPGETGYEISRSTKSTGTNVIATYKTTSGTNKKVSATRNKKYYYKVRAYKTVDGTEIYGPWSKARAFTIK